MTGGKGVSVKDTSGSPDATGRVRMGVFGGTFDPPHIGHRRAIEASQRSLNLDEVRVVVAGDPWQKSASGQLTPASHRLAMARLAFDGMEGVVVDDSEVRRQGPTYTVETLELLCEAGRTLVLVLGADAASGLPTWHRYADIPGLADVAVVTRAQPVATPHGYATSEEPGWTQPAGEGWHIHQVEMDPVWVSSRELRRRLAAGEDATGAIEPEVLAYVRSHGLYREGRDEP
jgi:nicotinate-nucleotide adenylyltransferase